MPKLMELEILGPDKGFFHGRIENLSCQTKAGSISILYDHAPLVSSLQKGRLVFRDENQTRTEIEVNSGILSVEKNHIVILTASK